MFWENAARTFAAGMSHAIKWILRGLSGLIFLLACPALCHAQDTSQHIPPWSGFGIEANVLTGKVFRHEAKFHLPIPTLTTGLDINFKVHTYGKKDWQQRRHYPTLGLGITYINYGIDSIYGRCFGLYPNIELPIISTRWMEWTLRLGDGIGYVTRHYSRISPPDTANGAIGSHINDFAIFNTDLRYHINTHWDVALGAHFTHISDASFRKPNLGVNMYGAHLGLTYFPVTSKPVHIVRHITPLKNRWLVQATAGMSLVSANAPNGPLYPVYLASAYVSRRWLSRNKVFSGVDYAFHKDVYAYLRDNGMEPGHEAQHAYQSAIFAGNEFLLGHVGAILQVGFYLHQTELKQDPYYEKVGGHYYFVMRENGPIKEFFLSAFLKTHKTIAEMGEIGLGIGF